MRSLTAAILAVIPGSVGVLYVRSLTAAILAVISWSVGDYM